MKIVINDHRKIFGVQKEFSKVFPNLKLNFTVKPHSIKSSAAVEALSSSKTIGQCRTIHNKGTITINPEMTAGEVSAHLSDVFGLTAIIERKSENRWVIIDLADKQTLLNQNLSKV